MARRKLTPAQAIGGFIRRQRDDFMTDSQPLRGSDGVVGFISFIARRSDR